MYNFHHLFGLPVLLYQLDPITFNREEIIQTIQNNFKKQNHRQEWQKNFFDTNIHHSLKDEKNQNFETPDYSKLKLAYETPIKTYINNMNFKKNCFVTYEIVNYTASKNESFMEPHLHTGCDLSLIHYLKFNKNQHSPTVFMNPYSHNDYWEDKSKFVSNLEGNRINAWAWDQWRYGVNEGDLLIFPAFLKHFVKNYNSDELRITISANIQLKF